MANADVPIPSAVLYKASEIQPITRLLLLFHHYQLPGAFYDQALRHVTQPEVKALFEELWEEEAEHVEMVEAMIAKLPPSARLDLEDEDEDAVPNSEGRFHPRS